MSGRQEIIGSVSARPLLTYLLVLALAGAFVYDRLGSTAAEEIADATLAEAKSYLLEHPYLAPPPLLARRIGVDDVAAARRAFLREQERRGAMPTPPGILRRRQEVLDAKVAEAASSLSGIPSQGWGLRPSEPAPFTWLSYPLAHAGWVHLLGNLGLLLILGYLLEGGWGHPLFALIGVITTLVAGATLASSQPGLEALLIGSSPLVAGLLGAYIVAGARSRSGGVYPAVAMLGLAWLGVPVWLGIDWSLSRELAPGQAEAAVGGPGASYWAFAGAFACGALAAFATRLFGVDAGLASAHDARREVAANPLLERALAERTAGRDDRALALLLQSQREAPNDVDASLALWDLALELGRPTEAASAMIRVIRDELQRGQAAAAVGHWMELTGHALEIRADPALLIRIAVKLADADQRRAASDALQRALALAQGGRETTVATRVALAARAVDPQIAEEAAWRALGSMELALEERQSIERLLAELHPRLSEAPPVAEHPGAFRPRDEGDSTPAAAADGIEGMALADSVACPEAIAIDTQERALEAVEANLLDLGSEELIVEVAGAGKKSVSYERIDGIAVASVEGLGPRPVIVIDLLFNWSGLAVHPLRLLRLRSDRFDPRRLTAEPCAPVDALRAVIARLLAESGAAPLPDAGSARGMPFAAYPSLERYEHTVLMSSADGGEALEWLDDDE